MKLSTWRQSLTNYITSLIEITQVGVEVPASPGDSSLFLPPVTGLTYESLEYADLQGMGQQEIYVMWSFDRLTLYNELPLSTFEGLYQTVAIRLLQDYKAIHPEITMLEVVEQPTPVLVSREADERSNWNIRLTWAIAFSFAAEPEVGTVQQPISINRVDFGLYRSSLEDFEDNVKDAEVRIDLP